MKINQPTNRLLFTSSALNLSLAVSDAFVSPYLWQHGASNATITMFAALQFVAMGIVFGWSQRVSIAPHRGMVAGVAMVAVYLTGVFFVHGSARWAIWALGILAGLGFGLYFQGFFVAAVTVVPVIKRDAFNARLGLLEAIASLGGPMLGTFIVSISTAGRAFYHVFAVSLLGLLPTLFGALGIRQAIQTVNSPDISCSPANWAKWIAAHASRGAYEGLWMTLPTLLTYELTHAAWIVGLVASMSAGGGIFGFPLAEGLTQKYGRKHLSWFGTLAIGAAILLLIIHLTAWSIVFSVLLFSIAAPLQKVPLEAGTMDIIGECPSLKDRFTATKELALNGGRAIALLGCAVLLMLPSITTSLAMLLEWSFPFVLTTTIFYTFAARET